MWPLALDSSVPLVLSTFHDITHTFTVGLALHKNLSGTGQWNVPKGHVNVAGLETHTCWNCNKPGCTPSKCKQPRDQARIDKTGRSTLRKRIVKRTRRVPMVAKVLGRREGILRERRVVAIEAVELIVARATTLGTSGALHPYWWGGQ